MNDLLPCPFCGAEAEMTQIGKDKVKIKCTGCFVEKQSKVLRYTIDWLQSTMAMWWNKRVSIIEKTSTNEQVYDDENPSYIKGTEDGI